MNNRLYNAFDRLALKKQDKTNLIPGLLGFMINGTKTVEVQNRPGYVYVRLRNNTNEMIVAFNDQVSPVYDLPVLVVRDDVDMTRYKISGRDVGKYENWGGVSSYLPRHGNQHSFSIESGGGGDIVWVYDKQFTPLLVQPSGTSGSGFVTINQDTIFQSNVWRGVGGTGTGNLLPYKPTGSNARLVLIYLDENGNPQTSVGNYFAESITGTTAIVPYIPSMPSSSDIPLGAVRLVSGTSEILWENLYDLRVIFRDSVTATGSASKHTIQDDGVNQTDRNFLNFVGTGFVIYDNGTATIISGTASGTGGATGSAGPPGSNTLLIYDDATFKVTGSSLNFGANLTVAVTGSTAFIDGAAGGGASGYPAIYDDSVYKVTGSLIDFGRNIQVEVTGTTAFVRTTDIFDLYDSVNQIGKFYPNRVGTSNSITTNVYGSTGNYSEILWSLIKQSGGTETEIARLRLFNSTISGTYFALRESLGSKDIFSIQPGYSQFNTLFSNMGTSIGLTASENAANIIATGSLLMKNIATPSTPTSGISSLYIENGIPKVLSSNGSIFVPINGILLYDDLVFKATGTALNFGDNLSVVITGTTAYINAIGVTGSQGIPGNNTINIYDDATFKVTGSSINFGDNLSVAITGSTAFVRTSGWIYPSSPGWIGTSGSPLTSTSWDGDAYPTTAKTLIDLSAVFGAPPDIKAILARISVRDLWSLPTSNIYFGLSPNDTAASFALDTSPRGLPNNFYINEQGICPCTSSGDVYYQVQASSGSSMQAFIQIWGYEL